MRVITGTARGRRLREPQGMDIRPTTDKVKESIFNIIQFDIEGRRILDLFAGTGLLGIEAASRGAESVTFVDSSKAAIKLVRENLRAIDGVLEWFDGCIDETGLLKRTMYWDFIDWATTWGRTAGEPVVGDDCHMAIASAMYVYFLRLAADLAELCGRTGAAAEYRDRADAVAAAIEEKCWNEKRGLYADETNSVYFSQQMQVWCTLSGIADGERARQIMENAIPLETKCTFAYAYFWFRALEQVGLYHETERMMNRLRGLLDLNCSTIPETPDAPRSECHAWGAIAIYEFAAVVLGVRTVSAAEKKLRIAPHTDGRTYAKGDVYTGCGKVWGGMEDRKRHFLAAHRIRRRGA